MFIHHILYTHTGNTYLMGVNDLRTVLDVRKLNIKYFCIPLQRIRSYPKSHTTVDPFKKLNSATSLSSM